MNKGAIAFAGLFSLLSIGGYIVSLATAHWRITRLTLVGEISVHRGLFHTDCIFQDCSSFSIDNVKDLINSDDTASKVAAGGVVLAALFALIAGIVLIFSACGKGSSGPKIGGSLLVFAVIFAVAGIATYIALSLQTSGIESAVTTVTFGYSLYVACAGGAMDFIAGIAAFAGA